MPSDSPHTVGEAATVEVSEGKYLFVLVHPIMSIRSYNGQSSETELMYFFDKGRMLKEDGSIKSPFFPSLVTFTDVNNPRSGISVNPKNLSATFGTGYKLKKLTFTETEQNLTWGKLDGFVNLMADDNIRFGLQIGKPN